MAYFYTKVPTNWSPSTIYQLTDKIILKPANRVEFDDYMGQGASIFFDTMYFITLSQNEEEHVSFLRNWLLFHAFIFNFQHICSFFEEGHLADHHQCDTLEEIPKELEANAYPRDYDNAADEIYFFYKPGVLLNYSDLFSKYQNLSDDEARLLKSYLFRVDARKSHSIFYSLFDDTRKYWQITNYIALIEAVICHAPNCTGGKVACTVCKKEFTHRKDSEETWRKGYLKSLGMSDPVLNSYLDVINTAYRKVRSATAHANKIGSPTYPAISGTEVYTTSRTIKSFQDDMHALDSFVDKVADAARFLLLNHLFQLSVFPPLEDLKVTHIGDA